MAVSLSIRKLYVNSTKGFNIEFVKQSTRNAHGKGKVVEGNSKLREICQNTLTELRNEGLLKNERVILSKQATHIDVRGQSSKILNFCANNYLGLADHPEVIGAAKDAIEKYGSGVASVRFICGTQQIHKELELKISKFHNREDTILYPSCFDANAGIFEALLTPEDAVLSDELNHASIIDGIRLCKAEKIRYKHRDMTDLELKLKSMKESRLKMIVTDGVFSMDGNVAPLPKIIKLAQKYGAITLVDECHATGFFGKTGRGTEEYFNVMGKVDIINSTLGKALGGASGGYTTGPREMISLLRQKSRPYLFSNSLPPAVVGAASKVFDLITGKNTIQEKIIENTELFRESMTKNCFRIAGDNHPICPVMIGDAKIAAQFAENLLTRGIYVVSFNYPVVPKNQARIRVQISASHTKEDIERTVDAFVEVGKKLGVIPADKNKAKKIQQSF
ncbi:2-amino-3-ketobutyrate coenzyme A ligase, putative [Pediculus humanus corporis]|uniref:2-amino-3-ketobutyrate coenzyme A ligase, mitochondrial n=1 Tax=Pediculus humanus subsp. corporis TaxID=121224 RepID=E0VAW7_PEDHC|nr:2-amino-3-ketobutyrate coenzyme A ligase, putative [Pediculus humanus corporis]EEB10523.1 2-amino-3-ketobutyrate coenzyme A ligase, putative [Pediculus humanus corporis]